MIHINDSYCFTDASYHKERGGYFKGSKFETRRTKCTVTGTGRKTLTFEKEYNTL